MLQIAVKYLNKSTLILISKEKIAPFCLKNSAVLWCYQTPVDTNRKPPCIRPVLVAGLTKRCDDKSSNH
jgi:hypothetical protein